MIDKDIQEIIEQGMDFVFAPYAVERVEDLLKFEDRYVGLSSKLGFPIGDEFYDFHECELSLLCKRPFKENVGRKDSLHDKLSSFGLNEIEIAIIRSYLQNVSGMYRLDAYYYDLPPFVAELNRWLQSALNKLPSVGDCILTRQCDHDKLDFKEGDVFEPNHSLTTSANEDWNDGSGDQYVITTLPMGVSKARSIAFANDYEQQVTFLLGARFRIDRINEKNDGTKTILMSEIE